MFNLMSKIQMNLECLNFTVIFGDKISQNSLVIGAMVVATLHSDYMTKELRQ